MKKFEKMKHKLDSEEQEILDAFEEGKLHSKTNAEAEIQAAREAARNTRQHATFQKPTWHPPML